MKLSEKKVKQQRKLFEAWMTREHPHLSLKKSGNPYADRDAHKMWCGWLGRSELRQRPPKDLVEALTKMVNSFYSAILALPETKTKRELAKHFMDAPAEANAVLNKLKAKKGKTR